MIKENVKIIKRNRKNKEDVLLREYRERAGLTQLELGKLIGTNQRTISAYEVGSRKPPIKKAIRIAKVFQVHVDDIFPMDC